MSPEVWYDVIWYKLADALKERFVSIFRVEQRTKQASSKQRTQMILIATVVKVSLESTIIFLTAENRVSQEHSSPESSQDY
jgi:hypothetical protein